MSYLTYIFLFCILWIFYKLFKLTFVALSILLTYHTVYPISTVWQFFREKFIYSSSVLQLNFPILYKFIWIVFVPSWKTLRIICRIIQYIDRKINRWMTILWFCCTRPYKNDEVLDEIFELDIQLKPEDIEENDQILNEVVRNRVIDYMKIVDDDFDDLFQDILEAGSYSKDLKVTQPDEYDLCLMIDLTRSIDPELIKIEPDENTASYVKIKICQNEHQRNENFWRNILDNDNYLNQNAFREWIHNTLEKALTAFSNGRKLEGYKVNHHENVYSINFRPKGPALTLTVIRQNNWRKIDVDLVPCLVFKNQYLRGFRSRKAKKWIVVAKPLQNALINDREILWRAGFQEDEKRILVEPIKPIIKLVKKLRDVQGWIHLKSYFIETLFMHELDNWLFRYLYSMAPRKTIFIYMLIQLQSKLEKGELLYYWHKEFNLLDKTNSLSLLETSKQLKQILKNIDGATGHKEQDEYLMDIFFDNEDMNFNDDFDYSLYLLFVFLTPLLYCSYFGVRPVVVYQFSLEYLYYCESTSTWNSSCIE